MPESMCISNYEQLFCDHVLGYSTHKWQKENMCVTRMYVCELINFGEDPAFMMSKRNLPDSFGVYFSIYTGSTFEMRCSFML